MKYLKSCLALVVLFVFALLASCTPEPETITVVQTEIAEVPVTRMVEVTREVEVTRLVEVEVTRLVEVLITATPRPTPRPTNTPDAPDFGERENPYPIGTAVGLIYDDSITFDMVVKEVIRGEEALQRARSANRFNEPPPEGYEFVLILLEVSYTGEDNGVLELRQGHTSVVTNNRIIEYGDSFSDFPCCLQPPFDIQLLAGGVGEGWVGLPVAVDDPNPLLLMGDADGVYFSLTP